MIGAPGFKPSQVEIDPYLSHFPGIPVDILTTTGSQFQRGITDMTGKNTDDSPSDSIHPSSDTS